MTDLRPAPLIMSTPNVTTVGAIQFVNGPVPQDRWKLGHPEHELWSPTSFLFWLNRQDFVRDDEKTLPGGPLGLRLITLTLLRIALLAPDLERQPQAPRLQLITWGHVEPCLRAAIRIVVEAIFRSAHILARAAQADDRIHFPTPKSEKNELPYNPFVFPPPYRL